MKKPPHPLLQSASLLAISIPILAGLIFAIDRTFLDDPAAEGILAAEDRVFRDASTSHDILDELIARDEVTWDPTNGMRIGRVLTHLKRTPGSKLLLVGSSQLLVVRDDRSQAGIARRVDKVLSDRLGARWAVYNLSLGGMTLAEKIWILSQAVDVVDFDYIIVGMTLWDSVSDEMRPWLANPRDPLPDLAGSSPSEIGWPEPAIINRAVTARFTEALEVAAPFFRHRTAIQKWLKEEASLAFIRDDRGRPTRPGVLQSGNSASAEPVRYSYTEQEQAITLERVDLFLASLQAVRSTSGASIMLLLTPFRQDPDRPTYTPTAFYDRFRNTVSRACARDGFAFLDASSLLDRSHFGIYADGPDEGKIDVLHFDASGHGELAGAIEESPLLRRVLRAAG